MSGPDSLLLCECGCGTQLAKDKRGRVRRFVKGHNRRGAGMSQSAVEKRKSTLAERPESRAFLTSAAYREKMRVIAKERGYGQWMSGKKATAGTKAKMSATQAARPRAPHTEAARAKMRAAAIGKHDGEKHWNWQGGIDKPNRYLRTTLEYKAFVTAVRTRDSRTCVLCGSKKRVQVDHIKSYAEYPELRLVVSNGRCLCYECHRKTPTWGRKKKKV